MPMTLRDFDETKCPDIQPNFDFDTCVHYDEVEGRSGFCRLPKNYRCLADIGKIFPLSYSSASDFITCHYLLYLKSIRGIQIRPAHKSIPLKVGTLWDAALSIRYGAKKDIQAIIDKNEIGAREVAAVKGLYRAYKELGITIDPGYEIQAKIDTKLTFDQDILGNGMKEVAVTGFYDFKYPDHFIEAKLSTRPDNYQDIWLIQSQVGTYFLADPSLQHCIMYITRYPDLKKPRGRDEEPEAFGERVYRDALSRPSHYFIGWDREKKQYGKKYYRSEFNLDDIKSRYAHILREIYEARCLNGWWKNDRVCNNILPGIPCDMLPVCRTGKMSEDVYMIREKPFIV